MTEVVNELTRFQKLFSTNPIFGIEYVTEVDLPQPEIPTASRQADDNVELIQDCEDSHAVAAYYINGSSTDDITERIEYDKRLGLAVEKLPEGISIDSLWRIN